MTSPLNTALPTQTLSSAPLSQTMAGPKTKTALQDAASDFEAAFIAQMLTHSGLAESLTSGEGQMASAFGTFFIEHLAADMAQSGGLGLADSIYKQLERYDQDGGR